MIIEGTSFDNVIHILTVVLALGLFAISSISYIRTRKSRFLYICSAFLLFAIKEIFITFAILGAGSPMLIGISHLLTFIILILFFIGVMK
jgi:hypothetical protein